MSVSSQSSELKTLAYGWHIHRLDGVTIGFTSHDEDQIVDGILLLAQPGLAPTKIISSLGTQSDGLDIDGALSDVALREEDLQDGRWNAAKLHIFLYDWDDLNAPVISLSYGELGEVRRDGEAFTAECLGLTAQLDHDVTPLTSPTCRARFGDQHCQLNSRRFTHELMVDYMEGNRLFFTKSLPGNVGDFSFGELRWLSGVATGLTTHILDSDEISLSLIEIPSTLTSIQVLGRPLDIRIEAVMGCNKTIATCSNRFQNSINFRGEPYLPGNDLLTRFPGLN